MRVVTNCGPMWLDSPSVFTFQIPEQGLVELGQVICELMILKSSKLSFLLSNQVVQDVQDFVSFHPL